MPLCNILYLLRAAYNLSEEDTQDSTVNIDSRISTIEIEKEIDIL